MQQHRDSIVKLVDAAVESDGLRSDLQDVWREQLANPSTAAAIASILKVDASQLAEMSGPPIDTEPGESGLAGSEILILVATWVATDVVLKALADLGKDAVKDALRKLWDRHLKPALERRERVPKSLGDEIEPDPRRAADG